MGLKVRYNGGVLDLSDAKYNPNGYGTKRLKIRTGQGSNDVKEYGLATSASYASDKWLKFNVNGQQHYIATSKTSTRQSNRTSYSSYYTYTYTQTYARNSVLTRQGTQTTYTYTEPARYTYRASYYNGTSKTWQGASYICVSTWSLYLSSTRASNYNATRTASRSSAYSVKFTLWWNRSEFAARSVSATWQAANSQLWFVNGSSTSRYTSTTTNQTADKSYANVSSTYPANNAYSSSVGRQENYYWAQTKSTLSCKQRYSKTTSRTVSTHYYETKSEYRIAHYTNINWLTASRSSQYNSEYATTRVSNYYSTPPSYVAISRASYTTSGPYNLGVIASASHGSTYGRLKGTWGHQANVSFVSSDQIYSTATTASGTYRTGNATLTSTNTPIGGVPSNYTLSAGPSVINSYASYTYTNQYCTRTYASNYSTSYWTVTSTLTSNNWLYSSLGSTVYTTSSAYTEHNFV